MRVLIVRVGAMGDVLHALPAVAALRAAQPAWQIDWVVDPRWRPLLIQDEGAAPVVNRVHLADTKLWSRAPLSAATARSLAALRGQLRAGLYDLVVDMQGTLRSAVIARMSGAPARAGYADPRERHATWFYTHRVTRHAMHVVEQGFELLSTATGVALTSAPSGTPPIAARLPYEQWADRWAAQEVSGAPLCLFAPDAGWGAKQWPAANFSALARALRVDGFDVAVTAPRADHALAGRVVEESGGAARLLVCNVAGLVAITRRAALVVGGDSGPVHLAAALGCPLVALFGPTDPTRNGPWGAGPARVLRDASAVTSYRHAAAADPSLARIAVSDVLNACTAVAMRRV